MRIFISYSRNDFDSMDVLRADLESMGHEVWFDHQIAGGSAWWEVILEEIRRADVYMFAITAGAVESPHCITELEYATSLGKTVLPVLLDDRSHGGTGRLGMTQWIDYRAADKPAVLSLARALGAIAPSPLPEPLPPAPMPPASAHDVDRRAAFQDRARAKWDGRAEAVLRPMVPMRERRWMTGTHPRYGKQAEWMAISADGRWLAVYGDRCVVWDLATDEDVPRMAAVLETGPRACGAFIVGGDRFLTVAGDGWARDWTIPDWQAGTETDLHLGDRERDYAVAVAPLGDMVALGTRPTDWAGLPEGGTISYGGGHIYLHDALSGALLLMLSHEADVRALAFSPDGRFFVSDSGGSISGVSGSTKIWDLAGSSSKHFPGHAPFVFSRDGLYVVTGQSREQVSGVALVHLRTMQTVRWFPGGSNVSLSPDRRSLAMVLRDCIQLWSCVTGKLLHEVRLVSTGWSAAISCFSPDGRHLVVVVDEPQHAITIHALPSTL